jgi:hypothetical protein
MEENTCYSEYICRNHSCDSAEVSVSAIIKIISEHERLLAEKSAAEQSLIAA